MSMIKHIIKPFTINIKQLCRVREAKSHLNGYNKPVLRINYEHLARVIEAKNNALKSK
tara:strand:+ start:948 stop:1121 length:174 start_codon:yes stop_codon:yes gene_type:complete